MALIILKLLNDVNEKLHANAVAMQIPVGFQKILTALSMCLLDKMATFEGERVSMLNGMMFLLNIKSK